jgi:hypothetical protein
VKAAVKEQGKTVLEVCFRVDATTTNAMSPPVQSTAKVARTIFDFAGLINDCALVDFVCVPSSSSEFFSISRSLRYF